MPIAAGRLRDRVTFQSPVKTADGQGGNTVEWTDLATVWGNFSTERGREAVEAGRLNSSSAGVLVVRSSSVTRQVTAADRVLVNGAPYQVRSIANPDRRNELLEMVVERGKAT